MYWSGGVGDLKVDNGMKVSRLYIITIINCLLFDSDYTKNKDAIICDFVFLFKFGPIKASWFVSFLPYV